MRLTAFAILAVFPFTVVAQPAVKAKQNPEPTNGSSSLEALKVDRQEAGVVALKEAPGLDTTYSGVKNPDIVMIGVGNRISFCPALSCIYGPQNGSIDPKFFDHQRTSFLISASTKIDAQAEEQTLAVTTNISSGRLKSYTPNTVYSIGDNILVPNAIYRVTKAGQTGAGLTLPQKRPVSAPFHHHDGNVEFQWINDQAIGGKLGVYFETQVLPGSGSAWGFANNFQIQPGAIYENAVRYGIENDFTNNDKECPLGIDCTAMRFGISGHKSTQAINITTSNFGAPALIWGMRFDGANLASESQIACDANGSKYCLTSNSIDTGVSYSQAFIYDRSVAPVGLSQGGRYNNGISLHGSYRENQITGKGWAVSPDGSLYTKHLKVNRGGVAITPEIAGDPGSINKIVFFGSLDAVGYGLGVSASSQDYIVPKGSLHAFYASESSASSFKIGASGPIEPISLTPSNATSTCTPGQHAWDAHYEYRCVAKNRWKRAALSDW
ncbi:hypothetical protein [Methylorubrum aminovorans]